MTGLSESVDEVRLHEVAVSLEFGEGLFAGFKFTDEGLVARDDFCHSGFDGSEVFRRERLFAVEVVEEAGVGGRAVAELGFGKEFEDGSGDDVRGGVADHFERVGIILLDELEARVGRERRGEIDEARRGGVLSGIHGGFGGLAVGRLTVVGSVLAGVRIERSKAGNHEAAARRGEMELAISRGVVPGGTSRTAPSGRCTAMVFLLICAMGSMKAARDEFAGLS